MKQYEEIESLIDFLELDRKRVLRERGAEFFRKLNEAKAEARERRRLEEFRERLRHEEQVREERRRREAWEKATAPSPPPPDPPRPPQPKQPREMTPSDWCSKQFLDWCFHRGEFAPTDEDDLRIFRRGRLYGRKK